MKENQKFWTIECNQKYQPGPNGNRLYEVTISALNESSYAKLLKICKNDQFESTLDADNKGYYLKDGFLYANEDFISNLDINDKQKIAEDMTEYLYQDL